MSATKMGNTALLTDVLNHAAVLTELQGKTVTREEIAQRLDVSSSTGYRYTNQLAELDLVTESGEAVGLTSLGETIAAEVATFQTTITQTLSLDDDIQDVSVELLRRSPGLQALSRRPLDRRELENRLGVSDTTGYRITRSLEDRGLIEKTNGRYEITPTGEAILEAVSSFEAIVRTSVRLGPVLRAIREEGPSVDVDAFAGATVTTNSGYTHGPQNRILELLDETDTLRVCTAETAFPSFLADILHRLEDGLEAESVVQPKHVAEVLADFPDRAVEACKHINNSMYLHDALWYNLAIYDERISLGVIDPHTGLCQTLVDTDGPAAREWAEAVYESYKEDAVHLPRVDPFTLREVMEQLPTETPQGVERA